MTDYYASGTDPAPVTDARRKLSPPARLGIPDTPKAPSLFQPLTPNSISSEPSPLQAAMLSGRAGVNVLGHKMSTAAPTKAVPRNPSEPAPPKDLHLGNQ